MRTEHTINDFNRALLPECHRRGECLCLSPMRLVVNAAGLRCTLCGEMVRDFYYSKEAKTLRSQIIAAAFPDLLESGEPG